MRKFTDFISKNIILITFFIIVLVVGFVMGSSYQSTLNTNKENNVNLVNGDNKKYNIEDVNNIQEELKEETKYTSNNKTTENTSANINKSTKEVDYKNLKQLQSDLEKIEEIIKENAIKKWQDDYRMVEYEYNLQVESLNEIFSKENLDSEILEKSLEEWGYDFRMVLYEYDMQFEAKTKLGL